MQLTFNSGTRSRHRVIKRWLHKDYILQWYHDADEWIHEIEEAASLSHYIVLENNRPCGLSIL